ncbi:hypothetical protein AO498_13325 [Algoriphagus sanaruensis]|uniref:Type 9 secretion system plug protein N-terminal domain-containing protein n=2 Tax=Algoriphagus sanaruensis TaxID=1727163 RepID=A0A142EQL8_9BACT|nr:hypothetical protein AO498_13325 [Algoriphagus sanaruensis]
MGKFGRGNFKTSGINLAGVYLLEMKQIFIVILFSFGFISSTLAQVLEDRVFVDHIFSVRLFPQGGQVSSMINSPVVGLQDSRRLSLVFDDLAYDPELYTAKLIHCNADWTKSGLKDTDFLSTFNQFTVEDYNYSVNTRIPYVHYELTIPSVTKSGNYIIKVYRNRDENQVLFTKRFMVAEELFTVGAGLVPPADVENRSKLQQLNVSVNYSQTEVIDPTTQIQVVIRQNQRWDNFKRLQKPTFVNAGSKLLRYESFDGENTFVAGNEFRFFDLRFIRATGVNIGSVKLEETAVYAQSLLSQPRSVEPYSQYLDINGQYVVATNDRPGGNPELESEYVLTSIYLNESPGQDIYVLGALTNWGKNGTSKMQWDSNRKVYFTELLLKQGWYDFQFALSSPEGMDSSLIEGSHFQTENEYEVLVYFRQLGSRYDQLAGYAYIQPNKRRF